MKYLWDFIFGVLLIGGAPWSVLALRIIGGDTFEHVTHTQISDTVGLPLTVLIFVLAFIAFGAAIVHRFKKRLLPKGFIVLEILFGVAVAFAIFAFYGVITYSIIG